MAKRAQAAKSPARDPWIPAGLGPAGTATTSNGKSAEHEEWLPAGKPSSNGRNGHNGSNGNGTWATKSDQATEPSKSHRRRRHHRLPKRATPRERWLILRLRRSRRRVDEQREVIERLKQRISELEEAANGHSEPEPTAPPARPRKRAARTAAANGAGAKTARAAKGTGSAKTSSSARKAKPAANGAGTRKRRTKLDLNKATFDELRGLGLSVTQTSRVIARREADGFASVDDLEEIPGLARATVTKLRSHVRVAAR
jgi:DNA uptake protein ComE-like DNA-binding protein